LFNYFLKKKANHGRSPKKKIRNALVLVEVAFTQATARLVVTSSSTNTSGKAVDPSLSSASKGRRN
jgi:hypothetical protein